MRCFPSPCGRRARSSVRPAEGAVPRQSRLGDGHSRRGVNSRRAAGPRFPRSECCLPSAFRPSQHRAARSWEGFPTALVPWVWAGPGRRGPSPEAAVSGSWPRCSRSRPRVGPASPPRSRRTSRDPSRAPSALPACRCEAWGPPESSVGVAFAVTAFLCEYLRLRG